jgi:hypothetical protein
MFKVWDMYASPALLTLDRLTSAKLQSPEENPVFLQTQSWDFMDTSCIFLYLLIYVRSHLFILLCVRVSKLNYFTLLKPTVSLSYLNSFYSRIEHEGRINCPVRNLC